MDEKWMQRALRLAGRGQGLVEPNPMVGALVVAQGKIVGEGYHRCYGSAHAEVHALALAGAKARGATLYVTLEPCCHFGKTPPCTQAILQAGISRVVAAMVDPFPKVAGGGLELLRQQGLAVEVGLLEAQARQLNAPFIKRVTTGRPWVIAKWAQSLDGAIATPSGESKWISGPESRQDVQQLRGRVDAIIVGSHTAAVDDPLLTARPDKAHHIRRIATRIVLDSHCRLSTEARLFSAIAEAPLMVVHRADLDPAGEQRRDRLAARGAMTLALPADPQGGVDLAALLDYLGAHDYANVLFEGGAAVHASLLRAGLVDEVQAYLAPLIIGGSAAPGPVGGPDLQRLSDAVRLKIQHVERLGGDLKVVLV